MVVLAVGCGKSAEKRSTVIEKPSTVTESAPPPVNKTWQATEAWRLELPAPSPSFNRVAPLADGSALVASYFEGSVSVGEATFTSRGNEDVVVHRISADGKLGRGTQLGGATFDAPAALVAHGDGAYLAIQSSGAITIAGKTFAPDGKQSVVALVTLDHDGSPTAACLIDIDAADYTVQMTVLADHDVVISADETREILKPSSVLVRAGADCTQRWRMPLGGIRVSALAAAGDDVIASASGDDWLGLWRVDAATGKIGLKHQLTKPTVGGMLAGDLGGLAQAQRLGDRDIALGTTGGSATLDGQTFTGKHLHPFLLAGGPQGASYGPVADVVAHVAGSGRIGETAFFGMEVIHAGEPEDVHRGTYLIAFGTKPQLLPLYQYKYEDDDWEHAPKQVVRGQPIRGNVAFSDDAAWIAGACDDAAKVRCISKIALSAK